MLLSDDQQKYKSFCKYLRYCRRDASEDYYGHTGAFRCLVEGGGDVAFVKHTTVMENTGGKRREWWARNTLNDDFELLCPDGEFSSSMEFFLFLSKGFPIANFHFYLCEQTGTRRDLPDYKMCNLGKVKANAVVTRGGEGYNETQINAYMNLLTYAQQYYGRKDADAFSFSMFYSMPPYHDLIFQDATQQLRAVPLSHRRYDLYLGGDFLRAKRITDCDAGAMAHKLSISLAIIVPLLVAFSFTHI